MTLREKIDGLTRWWWTAAMMKEGHDGPFLSRSEVLAAVEEWEREQKGGDAHSPGPTNPVRGDVTAPPVGQAGGEHFEKIKQLPPAEASWPCSACQARNGPKYINCPQCAAYTRPGYSRREVEDQDLELLRDVVSSGRGQADVPESVQVQLELSRCTPTTATFFGSKSPGDDVWIVRPGAARNQPFPRSWVLAAIEAVRNAAAKGTT